LHGSPPFRGTKRMVTDWPFLLWMSYTHKRCHNKETNKIFYLDYRCAAPPITLAVASLGSSCFCNFFTSLHHQFYMLDPIHVSAVADASFAHFFSLFIDCCILSSSNRCFSSFFHAIPSQCIISPVLLILPVLDNFLVKDVSIDYDQPP